MLNSNQPQPLFSILHTSVRPEKWKEVYLAWLEAAHDPSTVEYVLVVDHDWGFEDLPFPSNVWDQKDNHSIRPMDKAYWQQGPKHNYVEGVNRAAKQSHGKILIVNADDQYPCKDWDRLLLEKIHCVSGRSADDDFVILPSTGTLDEHVRRIAVMPILSRARYEKYGHVFYPIYESMFADNDFLAHARQDKCVIEAKHLLFPHKHPYNEGISMSEWDAAYQAQNRQSAFQLGYSIFEARRAMKFTDTPEIGVLNTSDSTVTNASSTSKKPTIAMCLPGENYSMEWVAQWTETFCQLASYYNIMPIFSYTTNVYTTRESLFQSAVAAKPDYIIWIDDDNIVAPGQIQKLIMQLDANKGIDVISGWCWLRSNAYDVIDRVSCGYWDGVKAKVYTYQDIFMKGDPESDLCEVGWTGFPVVAMRGSIGELVPTHPFLPILSDDYPFGHSGEDVAFCRQEHRLSIFVDRTVKVPHLKRKPDEPATVPVLATTSSVEEHDLTPASA